MLMARSSIYRVFFSILAVSALQAGGCYLFCRRMDQHRMVLVENAFGAAYYVILFAVGLFAVTFFLCRTGWETSSKTGYTLRRLSISERQVFLWQAVYNALVYVIFWTSQVVLIFILARWHIALYNGGDFSEFMLFFRSAFVRGFWSMEDSFGFVRNGLLCLMLGFTSARYPLAQRQGKRFGEIFPAFLITLAVWSRSLYADGGSDALATAASLFFIGFSLAKVLKKEETEDYYDEY